MYEQFIVKSAIKLPKDNSMCQICHKKPCVTAVIVWENFDSYKTDGVYICENCKKMYDIMGYNTNTIMNWAEVIMISKERKQI